MGYKEKASKTFLKITLPTSHFSPLIRKGTKYMKNELYNQIKEKAEYCLNCKNPLCKKGCPLGNNIPEFIAKIKEENYKEAYDILQDTTIMQPICGLICPHEKQCQGSCIRSIKGEAVHIGELEAFIGNLAIENNWYKENINEKSNKKVAIIGGGPAGLMCTYYLAKYGFDVTIYEKHDKLGGLLVHGIPDFRLNRKLVQDWINQIISLGIKVEYNKELGKNLNLEDLKKEFDAIFISVGANKSINLNIEGEDLKGVYGGNELLEKSNHPNYDNKTVGIIGGGNVAIDAARTVKKLGAKKVYVIYRRAEKHMPAERKEIEAAKKEGVEFLFQNNIVRIIGEQIIKSVELIKTELVKKEGETREVPVDIKNSNYELELDILIKAIGSVPEKNDIYGDIDLNNKNYIVIGENYNTSDEKVFAGGDIAGTKATVAYAARAGREAAKAINKYLSKNI